MRFLFLTLFFGLFSSSWAIFPFDLPSINPFYDKTMIFDIPSPIDLNAKTHNFVPDMKSSELFPKIIDLPNPLKVDFSGLAGDSASGIDFGLKADKIELPIKPQALPQPTLQVHDVFNVSKLAEAFK